MSIEKENKPNERTKRQMRNGGLFSTKEKRVIPGPRYATSGNVTMATSGQVYRFPNPYGATQVTFFGIASRAATSGHTLTTNTITTLPIAGDVYKKIIYEADGVTVKDELTITITGTSGSTTVFALATNPDYPEPETGTYIRVSGSGDPTIVVTVVALASTDIRADVFGIGILRPSYYFEPQSTSSVAVAKEVQKIIQSGKWFLIVDENASASTPEYRARSIETTLVNIDWPNVSTIVCRAEIIDYGPDWFDVEVTLAANWVLQGNFVCT